jgi:tRNA (adenine57-N1/adenine58-N1)-methyltransferase catalytic subunit
MKIKKVLFHKGKKYYWKSGDLHTEHGLVTEKDVQTKSKVQFHKGKDFIVFPASFLDNMEKIKRGPQIMTPKDIGEIITRTGMNKESKVLEVGSGSGALTSFMARIVKQVVSYEIRKDHEKIVEKNLKDLEITNVKLVNADASEIIKEKNFDIATIDIAEPWTAINNIEKALNSGGYIVSYSPSISQVENLIKEVNKNSNLRVLKTLETIERPWDINGRVVRPEFRIMGHTAFLTFIRKI